MEENKKMEMTENETKLVSEYKHFSEVLMQSVKYVAGCTRTGCIDWKPIDKIAKEKLSEMAAKYGITMERAVKLTEFKEMYHPEYALKCDFALLYPCNHTEEVVKLNADAITEEGKKMVREIKEKYNGVFGAKENE